MNSNCFKQEYNTEGAFSAAVLLSALAMGTIVVKNYLEGQVAKDVEPVDE